MKESEKLAWWSRFVAVRQMEWEVQVFMLMYLAGKLRAILASRQRNVVVLAVVMYWKGMEKEVEA